MPGVDKLWQYASDSTRTSPASRLGVNGRFTLPEFQSLLDAKIGEILAIGDVQIDNGTLYVGTGTKLIIWGSISCSVSDRVTRISLSNASVISGAAGKAELVRVQVIFAANAKHSEASRLSIDMSGSTPQESGILFECDSTNRPSNCSVSKCEVTNAKDACHIKSAYRCKFSDNVSIDNFRGFVVYSAESCRFIEDSVEHINTLPVAGFLNISTITESFGRGFIKNTYRGIRIDGWSEEGFSFDLRGNEDVNRSVRLNSHIATATAAGVSLVTPLPTQIGTQYSVVFQSGKLAGQQFEISNFGGASLGLHGFAESYQDCAVGDFVSVELTCLANIVEDLELNGSGDKSGIMVYIFGAGTKFVRPVLKNCGIEIVATALNTNQTWMNNCFAAPHNVSIIDPTFHDSQASGSYFHKISVDKEDKLYSTSNANQDDSMDNTLFTTIGLRLSGNIYGKCKFKAVSDMTAEAIPRLYEFANCAQSQRATLRGSRDWVVTPAQAASIVTGIGQTLIQVP